MHASDYSYRKFSFFMSNCFSKFMTLAVIAFLERDLPNFSLYCTVSPASTFLDSSPRSAIIKKHKRSSLKSYQLILAYFRRPETWNQVDSRASLSLKSPEKDVSGLLQLLVAASVPWLVAAQLQPLPALTWLSCLCASLCAFPSPYQQSNHQIWGTT